MGGRAELRLTLRGRLSVSHNLVDRALFGRVCPARRDRARDVGGVPLVRRTDIHDNELPALDETVIEIVVKRRRVRPGANDRREGWTVGAVPAKGVLDECLNFKL